MNGWMAVQRLAREGWMDAWCDAHIHCLYLHMSDNLIPSREMLLEHTDPVSHAATHRVKIQDDLITM